MMRYVLFGDESTLPQMAEIFGEFAAVVVCASNRPVAKKALLGDDALAPRLCEQPKWDSPSYPAFFERLKAAGPDYIFCFSYSMLLRVDVLGIPKHGAVNLHGGLLPEFRGANIVNWALIEDSQETGVTAHFMIPEIDAGDIILRRALPVTDADTAWTLKERTDSLGLEMLKELRSTVEAGRHLSRVPQDPARSRSFCRRRPEDGRIDWARSDREIFNLVRALVRPWPGAFFFGRDGRRITVDRYHTLEEIARLRKAHGY